MWSRNNAISDNPEDASFTAAESTNVLRWNSIALHFQAERSRQHDSSTRCPQTKPLILFAQPVGLVKPLLLGWSLPVACDWRADPVVQPVRIWKSGQEPIAKWPAGCCALLVPDPFSKVSNPKRQRGEIEREAVPR